MAQHKWFTGNYWRIVWVCFTILRDQLLKWIQVLLLKKQKEITLLSGVVTLSFLRFLHSWFQEVIITFWWSKCQLNNVIMTLSFYWSFFCSKLYTSITLNLNKCTHILYQLYVHLPVQSLQHNNARRPFFLTLISWIYIGKFL